MIKRSNLKSLAAFCLVVIISGLGGMACADSSNTKPNVAVKPSPATNPCAGITDDQLVKSIYIEIRKDSTLAPQYLHIDVISKGLQVRFIGWADSQTDKDKIEDIVKKSCAAGYDMSGLGVEKPGLGSPYLPDPVTKGCGSGYIKCGDFCIPKDEPCNIAIEPPPGGNANVPGNVNGNTNGNVNGNRNK